MVHVDIDSGLHDQVVKKVALRQKREPFKVHTIKAFIQEAVFKLLKGD